MTTHTPAAPILLVDDLEANLVALEALVRREGVALFKARTGAEALEMLLAHDVALALIDVQMPEMDGFELAELMRGTERTRRIPIIFLTAGAADRERRFRGYEAGAVDFLQKPLEPDILRSKLDVFVELYRQRQEVARQRDALDAVARENAHLLAETRRTADALRESERRLALALEAGRLGFWDWDVQSGRVHYGGWWATMLGHDLSEIEPHVRAWEQRFHPDDVERVNLALSEHFAGRTELFDCEYRLQQKDGSWRWILGRGRVIERDADDRPVRAIGTHTDVTERYLYEEKLREQDRRKDEFLATLAHELRNPLAPVRAGLEVLKQTDAASAAAADARAMMERQLAHMVRLIDDLLDIARISRGKVALKRTRVLLEEVLTSAVEASRPIIDAAGHTLTVHTPSAPVWLDGDLTRLSQIVSNLLNNASKYTPAGGRITLSAAVEGTEAVIRVEDNGIGLPAEMLPKIFDMFAQVEHARDRAQGGLGIGLSLARSLVEAHGGTLEASSAGPGQGSTFTVRLPVAPAPETTIGKTPDPSASAEAVAPAPLRILVVDDSEDGARSLCMLLKLSGHATQAAHDGPSAIDAARRFRPDLVFLDIGLPGMDGYEVCRLLRAEPEFARTRFVALTGWGAEEDKRRAHEAGFDDHLVKPVAPEDIDALLKGTRDGGG